MKKIFLSFLVFSVFGFFNVNTASAVTASSVKHDFFGGMVLYSTLCTCSLWPGSTLITISDYSLGYTPQSYMYRPGYSLLRPKFNIFTPKAYLVGGHDLKPSTCMVFAGVTCIPAGYSLGNIDFIRGVGSSGI